MSIISSRPSLLLGTRNPGKLREIKSILGDLPWPIQSLQEFENVGLAEETGETYAENAIAKAQFYARATGLFALADDSGLEVEALGGAPGVWSARYAGEDATDADRRALLLSELRRVESSTLSGQSNRRARFVCVVAIATPNGSVLDVSEGVCNGMIAMAPRGSSGFGYDPLFVPEGYDQTFAELEDSIKNRISHRGRALFSSRAYLLSKQALLDQSTRGS